MCYSYARSLTNFMGNVQEDIRQVEEKLKKLYELDMKLAPLFSGITSGAVVGGIVGSAIGGWFASKFLFYIILVILIATLITLIQVVIPVYHKLVILEKKMDLSITQLNSEQLQVELNKAEDFYERHKVSHAAIKRYLAEYNK